VAYLIDNDVNSSGQLASVGATAMSSDDHCPPSNQSPLGQNPPIPGNRVEAGETKEPPGQQPSPGNAAQGIVGDQADTTAGRDQIGQVFSSYLRNQGDTTIGRDQVGKQVIYHLRNEGDTTVEGDQIGKQEVYNLQAASKQQEEAAFTDVTEQLPPKRVPKYMLAQQEVEPHLVTIRDRRLILIGCHDKDFALDAMYALIEGLGVSEGQTKRLDFEAKLKVGYLIGHRSFLPPDANRNSVVQVEVFYDNARTQFNELIRDSIRVHFFESDLRQHGVYLLCLTSPKYLAELSGDPPSCAQWVMPFLRPLLKLHFPDRYLELEARILTQREQGLWSSDDEVFCRRLKKLIHEEQLVKEVENPKQPEFKPASSIFRDDDHIGKSILYVATYFPGLAAGEFSQLVDALLGDRKMVVSIPEYRQTGDQTLELVYSKTERCLIDVWRDNTDQFIRTWLCETDSTKDSAKVIDFTDYRLRDELKAFLERERSFFLKDQFNRLQNNGFLLHESSRVTEGLTRLSSAMFLQYPDEFNKDWLIDLVGKARDGFGLGGEIMQFISRNAPGALSLLFSRISAFMGQLLENSRTKDMVVACLGDLMRLGRHDVIFQLVKRLKSAPGIDEFYWIMQLLERADADTKSLAYGHLYNHVKRHGRQILEEDGLLGRWFPKDAPKEGRDAQPCSNSSRYLLHALIESCVESVRKLDPETYGSSPTRYALFRFEDKDRAEKALTRLLRWLFHPETGKALELREADQGFNSEQRDPNELVAALIAEWYFILRGRYQTAAAALRDNGPSIQKEKPEDTGGGDDLPSGLPSSFLADLLLQLVSASADKDQRNEMLKHLAFFRSCMMDTVRFGMMTDPNGRLITISADQRARYIWQQNRLWEVMEAIKRLSREPGSRREVRDVKQG
jgi:hypothetical protein